MKKSNIITLLLGICLFATAFGNTANPATFTPFTTIQQAEQYCPSLNRLQFQPIFPSNPKGAGNISGTHAGVMFSQFPTNRGVIRPLSLTADNYVENVQFREVSGYYGYLSGTLITCLYYFPNTLGQEYRLVMRSKRLA